LLIKNFKEIPSSSILFLIIIAAFSWVKSIGNLMTGILKVSASSDAVSFKNELSRIEEIYNKKFDETKIFIKQIE
jgi:hypothetical protein